MNAVNEYHLEKGFIYLLGDRLLAYDKIRTSSSSLAALDDHIARKKKSNPESLITFEFIKKENVNHPILQSSKKAKASVHFGFCFR